MKFVVTYRERRADAASPTSRRPGAEPALPTGLKVHAHLSRIGGGGGTLVVETTESGHLERLADLFSAYAVRIEPVIDVPVAGPASPAPSPGHHETLPEMPASEPHEGAFSDDDVYDTED